jgi:hypothetical protein
MHWIAIENYVNKYVGLYEQGEDVIATREEGEIGSMPFNRTLRDWASFDVTKRTKYDASISSGLALMGVNRKTYTAQNERPSAFSFKIMTY